MASNLYDEEEDCIVSTWLQATLIPRYMQTTSELQAPAVG